MNIEILNSVKEVLISGKDLIKGFEPIIVMMVIVKSINIHNINKDYNKKINNISKQIEIDRKYFNIDLERIDSNKVKETIKEFCDLLIDVFPNDVLTNMYNNINEVEVKTNVKLLIANISGAYNPFKNEIRIVNSSVLYHELFHLVSSRTNDKDAHSGFAQVHFPNMFKAEVIGQGLNEGYTDLLTSRYFSDKYKNHEGYPYHMYASLELEKIIGKNKMERLYLTSDLAGLVNELCKYSNKEQIYKFINNLDFLNSSHIEKLLLPNIKIKKSLQEVNSFLLETYNNKLLDELENNNIQKNNYLKMLEDYKKSLKNKAVIGYFGYHKLNKEKTYSI